MDDPVQATDGPNIILFQQELNRDILIETLPLITANITSRKSAAFHRHKLFPFIRDPISCYTEQFVYAPITNFIFFRTIMYHTFETTANWYLVFLIRIRFCASNYLQPFL